MSTSPPESYGLDQMDEVRDILASGRFRQDKDQHFIWKYLGLTLEDKIIKSYANFKQSTGFDGDEAIQQYFMSAGLIAKEEPDYRKEGLFDLLYDSISEFEQGSSRDELESAYYHLEK